MIGITFGSLLARQTEAASRYYITRANIAAEEDSYQSPRKLVKPSNPIQTGQSSRRSIFDLLNGNATLAQAESKKLPNSTETTAPVKNQLSRGAVLRAEIKKQLAEEAARRAGEKRKK